MSAVGCEQCMEKARRKMQVEYLWPCSHAPWQLLSHTLVLHTVCDKAGEEPGNMAKISLQTLKSFCTLQVLA